MTEGTPPEDGDSDELSIKRAQKSARTKSSAKSADRGKPAAKLTGILLSSDRFSARDSDFDGANDEAMAIRLATLEEEHRDLDAAIRALEENSPYERLTIARLKKKKLQLKDEIQEIKDMMLPDIIA